MLSFSDVGLIETVPRAPRKRPVPPVTGMTISGLAIEIDVPAAFTVPPGNVVTVTKSAVATHFGENDVHCLRIVYMNCIIPIVTRAGRPSWGTPRLTSVRLESYESPTPPAGGRGCATVGPCFVLTVNTSDRDADALETATAAATVTSRTRITLLSRIPSGVPS